jgi:hypothetical protein
MKNPIVQRPRPYNLKDLTGKVFGRLTVLEHAGSELVSQNPIKYKSVWRTKCTCGKEKIVRGADLSQERTKSCGCLSSENTAEFNRRTKTKIAYDTFGVVWQSYKRGAKVRGFTFLLSKEEFYSLTQKECHYCGAPPAQVRKARVVGKLSSFIYNGIDRKDSSIGYETTNCVPCCWECNKMKSDTPYDKFIAKIKQILNHLGKL